MKTESPSASLTAELETAIAAAARAALQGAPANLQESILYSLLGPGKRIRPRLIRSVGEAFSLSPEIALTLAAALEMTHAYTLVHDDLPAMDDDDFRRGRPTNHKVYGEGLAVLAGDALALLAVDVVLSLRGRLPADRVLALATVLTEAAGARGVIAGQAAEMDRTAPIGMPTALYEIFRLKTGALFRAALTLPALAAGAPEEVVAALGRLGDDFGVAFQIADDLEDDFAAKRSDPAHVAAHLEPDAARAEAQRRLRLDSALPSKLREKLAPYLDELTRKIAGGAV